MQTNNPFFDDIARVAGGALGALSGVRAELEALVRQQMERLTSGMDLVSREEFETVRAMVAKARQEQEILAARVAELEAQLASTAAGKPAAAAEVKPAKPRAKRAKPAASE